MENPTPRRLGGFYCFSYNENNVPRVVIGPDWPFAVIKLLLVNGGMGYFLLNLDFNSYFVVFSIGMFLLMVENIMFIWTVV